jgi:arginine N-succinyltransferase
VDIFDAGPCVACPRDQVRTVRQSRTAIVDQVVEKIESVTYMIGRRSGEFRACIGPLQIGSGEQATISSQCATALQIRTGDPIRFAPLRLPREPAAVAANTSVSAHESD